MRTFLVIVILVSCLFWYVTSGIRYYNVAVINRTAILPDKGYFYKTRDALLVAVDGELINIPAGFRTDLASIPKPFWVFVSPARSDLIESSIVHDYLYTFPGIRTRIEIDSIYYQLLLNSNVDDLTAVTFYFLIRLFGFPHFRTTNWTHQD